MTDINEQLIELKADIRDRDRRIADLQLEANKLTGDCAAMQKTIKKKENELNEMLSYIQRLRTRPAGYHPELILLTAAIICVVRLVWFIQVENWGRLAKQETVTVNEIFLTVTGVLLVLFIVHDARVSGWTCIAKVSVMVLAARIALQLWIQGYAPQATLTIVVALVFLAMPFASLWLQRAVQFLMNPRFRS